MWARARWGEWSKPRIKAEQPPNSRPDDVPKKAAPSPNFKASVCAEFKAISAFSLENGNVLDMADDTGTVFNGMRVK